MPYYIMRVLSSNPLVYKGPLLLIKFINMGEMEHEGMKMYISGL